jgi:hypothetical protein
MYLKVRILVVDLATGNVIREHPNVAWGSNNARAWLLRLGTWAFSTGHGLQILNMSDSEPHSTAECVAVE